MPDDLSQSKINSAVDALNEGKADFAGIPAIASLSRALVNDQGRIVLDASGCDTTAALFTALSGGGSTVTASQISDSTAVGRSMLTAANAAAQRTLIGAAYPTILFPSGTQIFGAIAESSSPASTGVLLGNSVTSIASYGFADHESLAGNLVIPNSVTTIGDHAFQLCIGLNGSLTLPNAITSIGDGAFASCNFAGALSIPNSLTAISYGVFSGNDFTGPLTIPASVTSIGGSAFEDNDFTRLTIPNSVTTIGSSAFYNCSSMTSAYLNQPIGQIGSNAFYYSALTQVYIGPSATGYTVGAGQTIGNKSGITVAAWTNYPNVP